MPNLAEAAALFSYGYWAQADGELTPDLTDRLGGALPANWRPLWSWIWCYEDVFAWSTIMCRDS